MANAPPPKRKKKNKAPPDDVIDSILLDISVHGHTGRALRDHRVNPGDFFPVIHTREDIAKRYAIAKQNACHAYAADTIALADDLADAAKRRRGKNRLSAPEVNLVRLQVDTRKWHLAKLQPKLYGDVPSGQEGGGSYPGSVSAAGAVLIVPGIASREDWERASQQHAEALKAKEKA